MFESSFFWLLIVIFTAVLFLLRNARVAWRASILSMAGILLLTFVLDLDANSLAVVALVVVLLIGVVNLGLPFAATRPRTGALIVFLPVLSLWIFGKHGEAASAEPLKVLAFVGFSYVLIKFYTLLRDLADGRVSDASSPMVAAYILSPPTFVSVPMHYVHEFDKTMREPEKLDFGAVVDAMFRIALGFLKIKFLAPILAPISLLQLVQAPEVGVTDLGIAALVYSLVLWLDFSGFVDIAIGASRFLGVNTPENFNRPYLAPNIREFWRRWHITFSRVLTSYLFVPISRFLDRTGMGRVPNMILAYLATFAFAGYWHGPTVNFVLWGLYHAVGLILFDLFGSRRFRRTKRPTILANGIAVAVTFVFVSLGWVLFVFPIDKIDNIGGW
jgi:D-alanyl-lipoteichoic acid acyltransferase DltB (MBOAT superfamily)